MKTRSDLMLCLAMAKNAQVDTLNRVDRLRAAELQASQALFTARLSGDESSIVVAQERALLASDELAKFEAIAVRRAGEMRSLESQIAEIDRQIEAERLNPTPKFIGNTHNTSGVNYRKYHRARRAR